MGRVYTTYLRYIEDLSRVDSWGAALLARLYHGIAECKKEDEGKDQRTMNKTLDGNTWSFFILWIPKLRQELSIYLKLPINLNVDQLHVPFISQIVDQLQKMSHNHRAYLEAFKGALDSIFLNLSHESYVRILCYIYLAMPDPLGIMCLDSNINNVLWWMRKGFDIILYIGSNLAYVTWTSVVLLKFLIYRVG
ncbi:hypothetical protein POM88_033162 [Heracleum sosnowskyi]|uniref:Uncharacterized protein n=1 Tax=Heracleum sosnowskyi TaxID=360622 RepID=A0AAD8MLK5_9APIA|nr:hypothetical protein POM88_033162 [Heracleum sosnowskyi]